MKGVINQGIKELIEAKFGEANWLQIKSLAGCSDPFFAIGEDYSDQLTVLLCQAASEVLKLPVETILIEFGKFWVQVTGPNAYPTLFKVAGNSPRQILMNLNKIHQSATRNIPNAMPPQFTYEEKPNGALVMYYRSNRHLCAVLKGLILGVGLRFHQDLQVQELECMLHGASHCAMEITFP